jgi:DNA-binding transcriptional regulator YiaG
MLRAALEFSERGAPAGGSVDLVASTLERAYAEARRLQLTALFVFPDRRRAGGMLLAAATGMLVLALLVPAAPRRALHGLAFAWPTPASIVYGDLEVAGGDRDVLAGEDVVVRVLDHGPLAPEMLLRFNDTGDLWKMRKLQPRGSRAPWAYEFQFEDIRDTTSYRFESGKRHTSEFRIRVVQRPIVDRFTLKLVPPSYTRRPPETLEEGRGDAIALFGTRVEIAGEASNGLVEGAVVPEGEPALARTLAEPLPLQIDGRRFSAAFPLRSDLRWHFDVTDSLGHPNADPVTYQLSVLDDRAPYVELRAPEADAVIPKSMQVQLMLYASDDFGISRMTLLYQREREGEDLGEPEHRVQLPLRGEGVTDAEGKPLAAGPAPELIKLHDWNLAALGLYPGDFVAYSIEVEDNDAVSGHKTARTPTYRLRLPTLGEVYAQIHDQDQNRMTQIDEVLQKGRELQKKYEQMARELKKNPEMDWKQEQEIQKSLEKQKELGDQVKQIAEDLQKQTDHLEEQQLINSQIAEKMEEIRKLMQDVDNETLREYMQRLQEAMKQISPEEIQRAMEKMQLSQEEFLKRLERTKSLLEQLKREQRLDALVERTAELLERQEKVGDSTDSLGTKTQEKQRDAAAEKRESERLGEEQSKLSQDTSDLEKELQQLDEEMQKAGRKELEQANREMQQQPPSDPMKSAAEQLQQQQPQQAQEKQDQASRRMRALYEQLMNAQMAMSSGMDMETAEALQKAARQSLDVSFREEALTRQAEPLGDQGNAGELARSQQSLLAATGKVVDGLDAVAQKSMKMPTNVTALLGASMQEMQAGGEAFEKGNALAGRLHGEEAYADLNRAVIELNRASKACSSGGGGSCSSPRDRLGLMADQQQKLNDSTRQMMQSLPRLSNPQSMTPEQRQEMARLLGEQRSIQQELQDVNRQARDQRDVLGRMDKMMDEMQEVVEDMQSESMDSETLRAQERIVSRMLQARRSLHKRDYNKERESRSVGEQYSKGGGPLEEQEALKKLRRDILRALESGTPEEYEELVREYFKSIAETDRSTDHPKVP